MFVRKEFYFIRHGETEHNAKKIIAGGGCDIPLNTIGREQSFTIRPLISGIPFRTICYSPMKRAKETMDIATNGLSVSRMEIEELRECMANICREMLNIEEKVPSCEQVEAFMLQTRIGINKALSHPGPVLIVSHGVVHLAICHQMKIKNHEWYIGNCKLVHFKPYGESEWEANMRYEG